MGMEVEGWQGSGGLLQLEEKVGPTFLFHCNGPEVTDTETECPPTLLLTVVQGT